MAVKIQWKRKADGLCAVRDLATTDTYLRAALGDNAQTTAKLMELANGSRPTLTVSFRGVKLELSRVEG